MTTEALNMPGRLSLIENDLKRIATRVEGNGTGTLSTAWQSLLSNTNPGDIAASSEHGGNSPGINIHTVPGDATSLVINLTSGTGWLAVKATNVIQQGVRRSLIFSYDGSSTAAGMKIYVDGALATLTTLHDSLGIGGMDPGGNVRVLTIAGDDLGGVAPNYIFGEFMTMAPDHLAIYNYAITAPQAAAIYAGGQ